MNDLGEGAEAVARRLAGDTPCPLPHPLTIFISYPDSTVAQVRYCKILI